MNFTDKNIAEEQEVCKDSERRLIEYLEKLGWTAEQILELIKYLDR